MKFIKNLFNFNRSEFVSAEVTVKAGKIFSITDTNEVADGYMLPGLIDSHVHIESSMLSPSRFSELAVKHGVVSVVTDPHEITNVLGVSGFKYMLNDSLNTPLKIFFGVPSCVPATKFETSGSIVSAEDIEKLLLSPKVVALSEMMNFPGVISKEKDVIDKILVAKKLNKVIDGHAPGLMGDDLTEYINSGISTDHEASTYEEALEKIKKGMIIQIREGSAAKNFESLYKLIDEFPGKVMLCTDDSHPDDLEIKYIDDLFRRGLRKNISFENLYKAVFFVPIEHYGLDSIGQLRVGDSADFIIVDNLDDFSIKQTYIDGKMVYDNGLVLFKTKIPTIINNFKAKKVSISDIYIDLYQKKINVIKAFDGELYTDSFPYKVNSKFFQSDLENDILKIVVLNRYNPRSEPVIGFINGFGLKYGAISSSIAHDSHNIIAIGVNDKDIITAINKVIDLKGGIVVANNDNIDFLQLEIAGLMTSKKPEFVSSKYKQLNKIVKNLGSSLRAPFMTMSFMSLLVIPKLKIGDKGLFNITKNNFVSLIID